MPCIAAVCMDIMLHAQGRRAAYIYSRTGSQCRWGSPRRLTRSWRRRAASGRGARGSGTAAWARRRGARLHAWQSSLISARVRGVWQQSTTYERDREAGGRTDDVGDVFAVGEAPRGAVRRVVDPIRRRVGARRGHEVVVVAVVHQRVAEDEEGARALRRPRQHAQGHQHGRQQGPGGAAPAHRSVLGVGEAFNHGFLLASCATPLPAGCCSSRAVYIASSIGIASWPHDGQQNGRIWWDVINRATILDANRATILIRCMRATAWYFIHKPPKLLLARSCVHSTFPDQSIISVNVVVLLVVSKVTEK